MCPQNSEIESLVGSQVGLRLRTLLESLNADLTPEKQKTPEALEAEKKLSVFVKQAWPVLEPGTPYIHGWHIDAICEHLEAVTNGYIHKLLINMPPRHMKSTLVSVIWPAWEWTRFPWLKYLYSSYSLNLSIRDSVACRRLIMSPWYQSNWGHQFQLSEEQNVKMRFENSRHGVRIATSVGGTTTGEGGDRVVCDDAHSVKDAESDLIRQGAVDWWTQAMSTRLNDPKRGAFVVVGQRVHANDLSGKLIESGDYEHLCLPARYEGEKTHWSIGWQDPRKVKGELLWPERFDEKTMASLERTLGSYAAAAQLQQRPTPAEGGIFKKDWFKPYESRPKFARIIESWDTATGVKDTDAFSVGQAWGETVDGFLYLLHVSRGRWAFPDLKRQVRSLHKRFNGSAILVEDKSSGRQICQELGSGEHLPIIPIKVGKMDKEARAMAASSTVEAGMVHIPANAPWLAEFMQEVLTFPKSAYKDQVDTMTQAINYFRSGSFTSMMDFS